MLDVDDTTLATWNYEIFSNWAFNPTTNAEFVTEQNSRGVRHGRPGHVGGERTATRSSSSPAAAAAQEAATLGNLTADGVGVDAGYPTPTTLQQRRGRAVHQAGRGRLPGLPAEAACAADPDGTCTTVHYKSATRAHIESLGYDIVANFGDQFSDLKGGHADRTFKMPNPNYFLP